MKDTITGAVIIALVILLNTINIFIDSSNYGIFILALNIVFMLMLYLSFLRQVKESKKPLINKYRGDNKLLSNLDKKAWEATYHIAHKYNTFVWFKFHKGNPIKNLDNHLFWFIPTSCDKSEEIEGFIRYEFTDLCYEGKMVKFLDKELYKPGFIVSIHEFEGTEKYLGKDIINSLLEKFGFEDKDNMQ